MIKRFHKARGFTLVEIAIVLVIIGLLLGGILKGQELINNAKVRAIADRQNSLKIAWFAFIDRYAAAPGDYIQAKIYIGGGVSGDGDGNLDPAESVEAFQQMTSTGLLRCGHCTGGDGSGFPKASNSVINTYGGVMSIWNDSTYYSFRGKDTATGNSRLLIHTGPRIPSNVIAEVDRKIDDGVPNQGDMRFNSFDPTLGSGNGGRLTVKTCISKVVDIADGKASAYSKLAYESPLFWRSPNQSPPVEANCGASVFI